MEGRTSITKDEIVRHMGANRVDVKENVYGQLKEKINKDSKYAIPQVLRAAEQSGDTPGDLELTLANDGDAYRALMRRFPELENDEDWAATVAQSVFGGDTRPAGVTRWGDYSFDPKNPTYRETVLHLPTKDGWDVFDEATGKVLHRVGSKEEAKALASATSGLSWERSNGGELQDFQSGHFPEPNIVGHMMTSLVEHDGKTTYLLDQIQSDWGQKLRDGGVRDEAKIATLRERTEALATQNDALLAEAAEFASAFDRGLRDAMSSPTTWVPHMAALRSFEMTHRALSDIIVGGDNRVHPKMREQAQTYLTQIREAREAYRLVQAERMTAEASSPGNPLVNTTDQWVNTTLRRAIRQAIEADAEYIAIPSGDTVLSYNPGDTNGMRQFYGATITKDEPRYKALQAKYVTATDELRAAMAEYDKFDFNALDLSEIHATPQAQRVIELNEQLQALDKQIIGHSHLSDSRIEGIVPKNLRNLLQKIDRNTPPPITVDKLSTPTGSYKGEGFTLFKLTDVVKGNVVFEGQPLFAIGGVKARTANLRALETAQKMEAEGSDYFRIRLATGWERGADGEWRVEFSDRDAKLTEIGKDAIEGKSAKVTKRAAEIIDNPLVFEAYPELKRWKIAIGQDAAPSGAVNFKNRTITVAAPSPARAVEKIVHEFQHVIQRIEGFQQGASPVFMAELVRTATREIDMEAAHVIERIGYADRSLDGSADALDNVIDDMPNTADREAATAFERDEDGAIAYVTQDGQRYAVRRDDTGKITAMLPVPERMVEEIRARLGPVFKAAGVSEEEVLTIARRIMAGELPSDVLREQINSRLGAVGLGLDNGAFQDLARLAEQRKELDMANFRALYERLMGEVEARNVVMRLKFKRGERIGTSLRLTEDVARDQQIVLRDFPEFQKSGDWEDSWFEELSRRDALYEKDDWEKSTRPVFGQAQPNAMERSAEQFRKTVTDFEAKLWKEGDTAAEIAAKIERRFGFPVEAADVAQRRVWWRVDELLQENKRGIGWSEEQVGRLKELEAQGLSGADIARMLNEQFGVERTAAAVDLQIHLKLGGRSNPVKARVPWSPEMVDMVRTAMAGREEGKAFNYAGLAQQLSEQFNIPVKPPQVARMARDMGLSGKVRKEVKPKTAPDAAWTPEALELLTSKDVEGLSYAQIAKLLSRQFEAEYTRSSVAGKLQRLRLQELRKSADDAERPDLAATLAGACKS
jgi:hypothetical protein